MAFIETGSGNPYPTISDMSEHEAETGPKTEKVAVGDLAAASFHWLKELARALVENDEFEHANTVMSAMVLLQKGLPNHLTAPSGGLTHDERAAILAGKKIEAIKLVRSRTGLGLKEAKDLVEAWAQDHGVGHVVPATY